MKLGRLLLLSALLPLACTAPGGGAGSASGFSKAAPRDGTGSASRLSSAALQSGSDEALVRARAVRGEAQAQYELGSRYFYGQGVPQDDTQAVQWFRRAAEQGHADAQSFLAMTYRAGRGVTLNFEEAAAWARKAAEQGHAHGQGLLGIMSFDGQGVPKDAVEGYKWETLAAARATEEDMKRFASNAVKIMAQAMTAEEIAKAETRAQAWVSARQMTEDLVREMALKAFCDKVGEGPFFIEVDGGPPSSKLLERLRDPRYHPIAQAEMTQLEMSKKWSVSVPAHGSIVTVGAIEWQSDHQAKLRLSAYRGPLDAFAEDLLVERDAAGQWSVRVVPGSQVVS